MRRFNDDLSDKIIYRGEGNSSIVVALKDKSKVIRLLKRDGKIMKSSQDHCITQHPMRSIRFIHSIMKPLTTPYLSGTMELVHLKSDFIEILSKKVESKRPAHRLDKILNLDDQYALVMDDLCALPSKITKSLHGDDFIGPMISVEIKPKQGFLLPSQRVPIIQPHINNDRTVSKLECSCLYGLNQHFKLARGRIEKTSNYCPLNLFSGCPVKMRAALGALLDNPQNNLRIFKDLILVYDETNRQAMSSLFDEVLKGGEATGRNQDSKLSDYEQSVNRNKQLLIDILIQCLLSEPTVVNRTGNAKNDTLNTSPYGDDDENLFCSNISGDQCMRHLPTPSTNRCDVHRCSQDRKPASSLVSGDPPHRLPRSCVLACVLRAQRLDSIGPFEARRMLEWLLEDNKINRSRLNHAEHKVNDILEELSKPRLPEGFGSQSQLAIESKREYYFRKVWEFLVSLTAKDCSIIITIRRITRGSYELLQSQMFNDNLLIDKTGGNYFVFHIGIADLDQKMPLKILRICENLYQIMLLERNQNNISRKT